MGEWRGPGPQNIADIVTQNFEYLNVCNMTISGKLNISFVTQNCKYLDAWEAVLGRNKYIISSQNCDYLWYMAELNITVNAKVRNFYKPHVTVLSGLLKVWLFPFSHILSLPDSNKLLMTGSISRLPTFDSGTELDISSVNKLVGVGPLITNPPPTSFTCL